MQPYSKAAVDAFHSRSGTVPPVRNNAMAIEEIPLGEDPTVEQISAFASELKSNSGLTGNRLLGFRKASDGKIKALVLKSD